MIAPEHPDSGKYCGEHKAGLREGFGKLILANGDKYTGTFQNNLQHGRGVYTWAKGDVYDGYWSDVRMHGIGKVSARGQAMRRIDQGGGATLVLMHVCVL
jgi:hypothetical protein